MNATWRSAKAIRACDSVTERWAVRNLEDFHTFGNRLIVNVYFLA